jgi:hypothetical protein
VTSLRTVPTNRSAYALACGLRGGILQTGFAHAHPFGLPLTCDTRSERVPLCFPLGFAPGHPWPRTPEAGTGSGH